MPAAPDLRRGEHAAGTTHVTEGSLTGTVSTATRNPRKCYYSCRAVGNEQGCTNLGIRATARPVEDVISVCPSPIIVVCSENRKIRAQACRLHSSSRTHNIIEERNWAGHSVDNRVSLPRATDPPSRYQKIEISRTGTPRLSRGLVTSLLAHGVGLTLVLSHAGVNLLDDVRSDRAGEDSGNGVGSSSGSTIFAENGDGRSGSHCEG